MTLLFGKLRGRAALAFLKHRRRWFSVPVVPEVKAGFETEDAADTFVTEDGADVFVTEAT